MFEWMLLYSVTVRVIPPPPHGSQYMLEEYGGQFLSKVDTAIPHRFILNKSENASLQLSIFCEKVLDKMYLLKLSNVS